MKQEGEESTVKAFPINYELNLISAGEEITFWGNDLKMKSKIKGSEIYSILFDLNNGRMAATKYNGEIDIINLNSSKINFTLTGHTKKIVAICAIDTENIREHIIATVSYDHTIRLWNILNRECIRVVKGINTYTSILIYEPRRKYLISSSTDTVTIMDYNTSDLQIIRTIHHEEVAKIYQLLQISEEQMISINFAKLSLKIWNIDNGKTIKDIYIPNSLGFVCGALLDKNTLILGEIDRGRVFLYDLNSLTVTNSYQIHQAEKNITQIYTLNATEAISCSKDKTIILFEIKTGNIKIILNKHKDEVNSILPVLLPLNLQFENALHIPSEYKNDQFNLNYQLNIDYTNISCL